MAKVSAFVSKNMAVLALVFAAVALIFPASFKWAAPQITMLLGVVMFGMGMTLRTEDFREIFRRPRDIFIGLLAQFTIMPLLAFTLALLLMWILAGAWIEVSFTEMMLSIMQVVIAPIFFGLLVNHLFADAVKRVVKILPLVSIVAILLIIGGVVSVNSANILQTGLLVMIVVMCHNLFGYELGYGMAKIFKMNFYKAKAVSIEVGMQNSGPAVSLAMTHLGATAAIPGAIFSVWHNISGSIVANYLSSKTGS